MARNPTCHTLHWQCGLRTAAVAALFLLSPGVWSKEKSVRCASAQAYAGPPLHAPVDSSIYVDATQSAAGTMPPELRKRLADALSAAQSHMRTEAITAAVVQAGVGEWSTTPQRFHWASVGKAFTAVVVMQLIEEGKLSLDTSLAKFAADMPNAKIITIDHLLTHTSGLFSFQADRVLRAKPGYKAPEELLAVAKRHGADFCAGYAWSYSNTGYVLLARIIEQIEGKPYHEVLRERIVGKLNLAQTQALAPRERPENFAAPPLASNGADFSGDITSPFGAGVIIASASDMIRFWQGLLANKLLQPANTAAMFAKLYPMFAENTLHYGRGVMVYDVKRAETPAADLWLGHSGGTEHAQAVVAYSTLRKAFVAVALTGTGSAEATANLLLQALDAR